MPALAMGFAAAALLAMSTPGFAQSCPASPPPMDVLLFLDNSGSISNAEFNAAQQAIASVAEDILSRPGYRLAVVNWACLDTSALKTNFDGCRIDLATGSAIPGGWSSNPTDFAYDGNNSSANRVCRSFGNTGGGAFLHRNNCGGANFTQAIPDTYIQDATKVLDAALYNGGGTGGTDSYGEATIKPGAVTQPLMLIHMTDVSVALSSAPYIRRVAASDAALGHYYYSNYLKNMRGSLVAVVGIDGSASELEARRQLGAVASRGGSSMDYDTTHQSLASTQAYDRGTPRLATFSATFNAAQILEATTEVFDATIPACVVMRKQSAGGTGTFDFTGGTNGLPANLALTTTAVDTPVSSPAYILPNFNTDTGIRETIPEGWEMSGASCVNASNEAVPATVNTTTGQITIPGTQITSGAQLTCTVVNTRMEADLWITKTNTPADGTSDLPDDTVLGGTQTTYRIVVGNNGPSSVANAALRDPAVPGLADCTLAAPICTTSGTATCPTEGAGAGQLSIDNLQGPDGVLIPMLGMGGSIAINLTCTVE